MIIQRNKASWTEFRSKSKTHITETYIKWVIEVQNVPDVADVLADYKEGLGYLLVHVYEQEPRGLGVAGLNWRVEMHTFVTSWREFTPALEYVSVMFCMPLFIENTATGIVLSKEEEGRL